MARAIDLTPKGCKSKQGRLRIQKALDGRSESDFQCYQKLAEICVTAGDDQLIKILTLRSSMTEADATEFVGDVHRLLRERTKNDDELLRAVAGVPPIQNRSIDAEA